MATCADVVIQLGHRGTLQLKAVHSFQLPGVRSWNNKQLGICSWAGINKQLRAKGVQEGDTVVVGGIELQWSDDQSEGALYAAWREDKLRRGTAWQGTARWPHAV